MRLCLLLLAVAARRWPPDIAADLLREWQAELSVLRSSRFQMLMYAGSLAVAPTADGPSWSHRTTTVATAAGATLLAATLSNAVHTTAPWLILPAAALMAVAATRTRLSPLAATALITPPLFAFLFLGNAVSVMPFMGFQDVAPAIATWSTTLLTTLFLSTRRAAALPSPAGSPTSRRASRRPATAFRGPGVATLLAGSVISLIAATVAGSLNAAHTLGISPWSAPLWFPLSLLPADTTAFGPVLSPAALLPADAAPTHASAVLLGNATVLTAPLLLCTVFVLALAFSRRIQAATSTEPQSRASTGRASTGRATADRASTARARRAVTIALGPAGSPRRQATLGGTAALTAVAACQATLLAAADPTALAHRVLDHSAVFGFGFATHPAGLAATALLAAALTLRLTEPTPT
ncbi:hypothetical protein AB0M54_16425 [Actinoplanes sp. NPDC051470]|uniref:hypothetical protein n=1 Tax=Actinoplanes sp. NPDC051470 TaxID=3157224 RepID=UPI0034186F2F